MYIDHIAEVVHHDLGNPNSRSCVFPENCETKLIWAYCSWSMEITEPGLSSASLRIDPDLFPSFLRVQWWSVSKIQEAQSGTLSPISRKYLEELQFVLCKILTLGEVAITYHARTWITAVAVKILHSIVCFRFAWEWDAWIHSLKYFDDIGIGLIPGAFLTLRKYLVTSFYYCKNINNLPSAFGLFCIYSH